LNPYYIRMTFWWSLFMGLTWNWIWLLVFNEVPISSQKNERSCICVLGYRFFYNFSTRFWNGLNILVCFCFIFLINEDVIALWFWYFFFLYSANTGLHIYVITCKQGCLKSCTGVNILNLHNLQQFLSCTVIIGCLSYIH
jgi:hypothetical protein